MIMNITINNFFINNEGKQYNGQKRNYDKEWDKAVKEMYEVSQRVSNENKKGQCELERVIKECKEICYQLYRDGTVNVKTLSILYNNIETIEKLIKGLDRIGVVTEVPDRGYNYAIYDCSSNAEISVKLDEDTTKTILEQCKGILIKQFKEAADKL